MIYLEITLLNLPNKIYFGHHSTLTIIFIMWLIFHALKMSPVFPKVGPGRWLVTVTSKQFAKGIKNVNFH